jgi:hypothetical protein
MAKISATADRVTRTITLPIREIVSPEGVRILDAFIPAWRMSTHLANWAQLELACRDVRRTPEMTRLPAYDNRAMFGTHPARFNRAPKERPIKVPFAPTMTAATKPGDPKVGDLYGLWNLEYPRSLREAWDGCTVGARDILTAVEDTWKGHKNLGRFAVMWRGEASAATFRFPYPFPIPSDKGKTLRLSRVAESDSPDARCVPQAQFPLPNHLDGVTVRLADGREFRRQLRQFDFLIANPDRLRQAKITGRRAGGCLVGADIKIVGAFDKTEKLSGLTAGVSTGSDCVFRAVLDGDDGNPFVIHADQLRGVIHCYDRWRHRFATDLKHEKRWPADKRRRTTEGATAKSRMEKMNGRIDSERKQMVACLVGWLVRQGVGDVEYDDSETGYFDWTDTRGGTHRRFDMTRLREAVKCKCEEEGISFENVTGAEDA